MTLMEAPVKTELTIVEVGSSNVKIKKLKELGLIKGSRIQILNKSKNSMIVKCRGVIYGMDKKLAMKVVCEDI